MSSGSDTEDTRSDTGDDTERWSEVEGIQSSKAEEAPVQTQMTTDPITEREAFKRIIYVRDAPKLTDAIITYIKSCILLANLATGSLVRSGAHPEAHAEFHSIIKRLEKLDSTIECLIRRMLSDRKSKGRPSELHPLSRELHNCFAALLTLKYRLRMIEATGVYAKGNYWHAHVEGLVKIIEESIFAVTGGSSDTGQESGTTFVDKVFGWEFWRALEENERRLPSSLSFIWYSKGVLALHV
jgi:hypothetical protein